jgi:hypothetical protein
MHFNSVLDSVDAYITTLYNPQKSINISRIRCSKRRYQKFCFVLSINKAVSSTMFIYTATKKKTEGLKNQMKLLDTNPNLK